MRAHVKATSPGGSYAKRGALALACAVALLVSAGAGSASAACPNEAFRKGYSAFLPECRAYEQVSPQDKNNSDVEPINTIQSSPDGNGLLFPSTNGFPGGETSLVMSYFRATRSSSQWSTESVDPAQINHGTTIFRVSPASSEDLTKTLGVSLEALTPDAAPGNGNIYLRDNPTRTHRLVATGPPALFGETGELSGNGFVAASSDLSHILLRSNQKLTPDALESSPNVYEWDAASGLRLASVLPNGTPTPAYVNPNVRGGLAMSQDGSRAVFVEQGTNVIYLRENGQVTKPVSFSERSGDGGKLVGALLLAMSRDGSSVLFRPLQDIPLTDDPGASGSDIYRYDVDTEQVEDVTLPLDPNKSSGVTVLGLLGLDSSGSRLYFKASGVLAPGAVEGQGNLYESHNGTAHLIASFTENGPGEGFAMAGDPAYSANGLHFTFKSYESPAGFDNQSPHCAEIETEHSPPGFCSEVYTYDAGTQELHCVSCNANAVSLGHSTVPQNIFQVSNYRSRSTLNDGRVFFTTEDSLLPADVNDGKIDVYEWDEGNVSLISTGTSSSGSGFADATPDGSDVFITTSQQLVAQDKDHNIDVYDARVGGGLAAQQVDPDQQGGQCEGEGCRGSLSGSPASTSAATSAFVGPPNKAAARKRCVKVRKGVRSKAKSAKAKCRKAPRKKKRASHRNAKRAHGASSRSGK